jgi:drug/metabolite transporter (DMT)-like permease
MAELATETPRPRHVSAAPAAAALLTLTLWASAFAGIRSAGHHLSPGPLALGRLLVGNVSLGALVLARREPLPARRDLPAIALCGVLWFGLYSVVLNDAERRVDAGTAAMLVNTGLLIALLAGVLLREGFPRKLVAGCAVAFGGAALIGAAT